MKLQNLITSLFIVTILTTVGCKKDNQNNSGTAARTFTPVYIAPSQPGILQVSQTAITIQVGQSATVSALVFNSDGSAQASQPSLFWSVDSSSIASVSSGLISGLAEGTAIVSVTDGNHGIQYIGVHVVSSGTTISTGASEITFNPPVLLIAKQQSANFQYTIRNRSGQSVSVTPTFISSAGISISSQTVHAGSTTGSYTVIAVTGTDTLRGALDVVVYDPQSTSSDTTTEIYRLINFPCDFSKSGLTAAPLRIGVRKTFRTGSTLGVLCYQTSPDAVDITNTNVLTMSASGCLSSVAPGSTFVYLTYGTQTIKSCISYVAFDLEGTWSDGTTLQIVSPGNAPHIHYTGFEIVPNTYNPNPDVATYQGSSCSGTNNTNCRCNSIEGVDASGYSSPGVGFTFYYLGDGLGQVKQPNTCAMTPNFTIPCGGTTGNGLYVDNNHIKLTGLNTTLARGGTLSTGGGGSTLQSTLLAKNLWVGNSCWLSDAGMCTNNIKFNANHTLTAQDVCNGNASHTGNWAVNTVNNTQEIVLWNNTDTLELPVASYTSSSITFSDNEYGCTLQWSGQ